RLNRLKDGAPVLNSHRSSIVDILGVHESVRIEGGKGYATLRMADTPDLDIIWRKILKGFIRHISVGYRVHEWNIVRKEGQITTKTATDWEPFENSFVAIPADSGCGV